MRRLFGKRQVRLPSAALLYPLFLHQPGRFLELLIPFFPVFADEGIFDKYIYRHFHLLAAVAGRGTYIPFIVIHRFKLAVLLDAYRV